MKIIQKWKPPVYTEMFQTLTQLLKPTNLNLNLLIKKIIEPVDQENYLFLWLEYAIIKTPWSSDKYAGRQGRSASKFSLSSKKTLKQKLISSISNIVYFRKILPEDNYSPCNCNCRW